MVGVAVNVTDVPVQMVLADGVTETLAGSDELTTIVTALDVAGLPVAQVALDVITQTTASLLAGV